MSTTATTISQDSRERDCRVEDYLNDKFQTLGDLQNLEELLNTVQTQHLKLRDQVPYPASGPNSDRIASLTSNMTASGSWEPC